MIRDTFCIIPARSGSKGIKNKNIMEFNQCPLLKYSIDFAKKLKFVKKIIVSTDSKKYLNISRKYGVCSKSLRPNYLSSDFSKTIDVVKFEFNQYKNLGFEKILILQPTCPFRKKEHFNASYHALDKGYESAITIHRVSEFPQRMLIKKGKKLLPYISNKKEDLFKPRQAINQIYIRTGSMYFFISKNINKKNFLGSKIFFQETFGKYQINIDNYKDVILTNYYFNEKNKNKK